MSASMATISVLLIITLFFIIPVMIGVYVYRDAKRRRMNAFLWAVVSVLAPSFIGLIIYLLVRGSHSDLKCPNCTTPVTEQYVVCPKCGSKLRPSCPNCSAPVETDWSLCPMCAQPLPAQYDDIIAPVHPKDKTIWKILATVIILPVVLCLILIALLRVSTISFAGSANFKVLPLDSYFAGDNNSEFEEWLENIELENHTAYIQTYQEQKGDALRIQYLIYLPVLADSPSYLFRTNGGLFGDTITLSFSEENGSSGNALIRVTYNGERVPKLKIFYEGERVDCEITEVNSPLN